MADMKLPEYADTRKERKALGMDKSGSVTTNENGERTRTPQPKVLAGAITGVSLAVLLGMIEAITPGHFEFLGSWGVVVYGGIVALGSFIASYVKRPNDNAS